MIQEWIERLVARAQEFLAPYLRRAGARFDPLYAQWRARYLKLEPRERILVQIAAGLVGVLLAYNLIYRPITGIPGALRTRVEQRERDLADVRRMTASYQQLKSDLGAAEGAAVPAGKDFSLFSEVESTLTKSIGREKIASITPSTDRKLSEGLTQYSVELKLSNLSLAQVVDTLHGIRSLSVPVSVASLRIQRRSQDSHTYDVDMTCVALGKNG